MEMGESRTPEDETQSSVGLDEASSIIPAVPEKTSSTPAVPEKTSSTPTSEILPVSQPR